MRTDFSPDSLRSTAISAISELRIDNVAENHEMMLRISNVSPLPCPFVFPLAVEIRYSFLISQE